MIRQLEDIYPEGSDLTIMNTYYNYPVYKDGKKLSDDFLLLTYRDNVTGKKNHIEIKKPEYRYYMLYDDEKTPDYGMLFVEREKVRSIDVPFNVLEKDIAKRTNNVDFYKRNLRDRNRIANRRLHTHPRVFFSDVNIENHYRFRFANTYMNNLFPIHKAFFDIEVDGKFAAGDFVELGECEINCVTYLDAKLMKAFTFILRNPNNPQIAKLEENINSGKFGYQEIHSFITEACGGPKRMQDFKLENLQYSIQFYTQEIDLIAALFETIHETDPDFVEGWNSSAFDISYIIARIYKLGHDPADIMCNQKWKYKVVKNYVDVRNINNGKTPERGDYTYISGNPVFIDQMIQYASIRKPKFGSMGSTKLDDIGEKESGIKKLDYHHITNEVTELPWLDFLTFVLYNIMDTIVQYAIEFNTQDLEYIFTKAVVNNTVYHKAHRQTIYLVNRIAAEFYKMGYIIGNNQNRENEKPPKYLGAVVGEPKYTNDFSKMKIQGTPIFVVENLYDFD